MFLKSSLGDNLEYSRELYFKPATRKIIDKQKEQIEKDIKDVN